MSTHNETSQPGLTLNTSQFESLAQTLTETGARITEINQRLDGQDARLTEYRQEIDERLQSVVQSQQRALRSQRKTEFAGVDENNPDAQLNDIRSVLSRNAGAILVQSAWQGVPVARSASIEHLAARHHWSAETLARALDTQTPGEGLDFVHAEFSRKLLEKIRLENRVVANIRSFDLPRSPFIFPIAGADPAVYYIPENNAEAGHAVSGSHRGTAQIQFDARKLASKVVSSYELDADSLVAVGPFVTDGLIAAINNAVEYALVRGDRTTTGNINRMDGTPETTPGAAARYLVTNGIDHFCIKGDGVRQGAGFELGSFQESDIAAMRQLAGRYGVQPSRLMLLCDVNAYYRFFNTTNFPNIVTLEKYGSQATILTGELMRIFGIPVIVSENIPLLTDGEGGMITSAGGTKSSIRLIHRDGVLAGFAPVRGNQRVLVERSSDIETQQDTIVASVRFDVQFPHGEPAHAPVVLGYDID